MPAAVERFKKLRVRSFKKEEVAEGVFVIRFYRISPTTEFR
jgi:hypothetical protein